MSFATRQRQIFETVIKTIHVGDTVRCSYRSPWVGIVLSIDEEVSPLTGNRTGWVLATVRITHDKNGTPVKNPLKRKWVRVYGISWFTNINEGRPCPKDL